MAVMLRRLKIQDCEGMFEWMHDMEIAQCFRDNMSVKDWNDVLEFVKNSDNVVTDGASAHFAIVEDTDEYLGTISLKNINLKDKNAEYAISLRRTAWGRGIGQAATMEVLRLAFMEHGLERIYLNVLENNIKAIHLYEKCGFVLEGKFRHHLYRNGVYNDLRWYAMLRDDYVKNLGGGVNCFPAFRL